MNSPFKQHLIDPEICIRCYTCEATCPIGAIEHDDNNVVVDASKCDFCMACISPCPTGSIDEWRVVNEPYSLEDQYAWDELPEQVEIEQSGSGEGSLEALDNSIATLLMEAHRGSGGKSKAPASAAKPTVNLYNQSNPAQAIVQGNYRLTSSDSASDTRHIILDMGVQNFPVLEGQSIGIIAPGEDENGKPHLPRLYSIASPRDGERPNHNNIALTVKREEGGICSNYLCDLEKGASINVSGPFGATFLMPNDPNTRLLMICTGTGSAPMRGFTMRRQRENPDQKNTLALFFGARTRNELPYFGPLNKMPDSFITKHFAFSREPQTAKVYVQDRMRENAHMIAEWLGEDNTHIYVCGLKAMEEGVESALNDIATEHDMDWEILRNTMREDGRFHVETY